MITNIQSNFLIRTIFKLNIVWALCCTMIFNLLKFDALLSVNNVFMIECM